MLKFFRKANRDIEVTWRVPPQVLQQMDYALQQEVVRRLSDELVDKFRKQIITNMSDKELADLVRKKAVEDLLG